MTLKQENPTVAALRQYAKTLATIHQSMFERIASNDEASTLALIEVLEFLGTRCSALAKDLRQALTSDGAKH